MNQYLSNMESLLNGYDAQKLRSISEPVIVGVPPADACHSLCVLPDGEIRFYGKEGKNLLYEPGQRVYISSRDCGLTWKLFPESEKALGQSVKSPYSDRYMAIINTRPWRHFHWPVGEPHGDGTYAVLSEGGPSSTELIWRKISDFNYELCRLPVPLRMRKRWIVPSQVAIETEGLLKYNPVMLISDDDGDTWKEVNIKPVPRHKIEPPHEGVRWQNDSCEPTLTEFSDGTLMLIARTSQDYHYRYYSHDGGDTWTDPESSGFHGTLTMPTLYRLSDGRTLFLWCNTQPLPELKHEDQRPQLSAGELNGHWEDVFTNRDANHAAISEDDGKTWKGFREIWLNPIRNDADFRSKGGNDNVRDKSVHQIEAMELPFGKVLLAFGQHDVCRKLAIFEPNWLYEKSRSEDFRYGAGALSTQVYLKSVSGGFRGFSGHCAWNRTNGAVLVPDPDENFEEALLISRIHDERLFSEVQGACWNFPAAYNGYLTVRLRIEGEGVRLSLTDRWFNPIDSAVKQLAAFTFIADRSSLPSGQWIDIKILWESKKNHAKLIVDDKELCTAKAQFEIIHGICYLHIQSLATDVDERGTLIKKLNMKSLD